MFRAIALITATFFALPCTGTSDPRDKHVSGDQSSEHRMRLVGSAAVLIETDPTANTPADEMSTARAQERDLIRLLTDTSELVEVRLAAGEALKNKSGPFLTNDRKMIDVIEDFVTQVIEEADKAQLGKMLELGTRLLGSIKLNCEKDLETDPALHPARID